MAAVQMNPAQFQQLLDAMAQAIAAAVPPPVVPPAAAAAAAAPFALAPGGGENAPVWDFTSGDGLKLYVAATEGMEPKFDGKQENLQYFLDCVQDKGNTYGWNPILNLNDAGGVSRDITTEYGALNQDLITNAAMVYQVLDNRNRQASAMLIAFINNSLTH
jgi:hypothetical protein